MIPVYFQTRKNRGGPYGKKIPPILPVPMRIRMTLLGDSMPLQTRENLKKGAARNLGLFSVEAQQEPPVPYFILQPNKPHKSPFQQLGQRSTGEAWKLGQIAALTAAASRNSRTHLSVCSRPFSSLISSTHQSHRGNVLSNRSRWYRSASLAGGAWPSTVSS